MAGRRDPTGVEGAGGSGCGAGGRRQGLAKYMHTKYRPIGDRRDPTGVEGAGGSGCGAGGRRQNLDGQHTDTPPDWRPPRGLQGLAAVPVGGGRARAGFEIDHSEPQARVWRSRGRPGPKAPGTPAEYTKQPGPASGRAGPAAVGDQARPQATPEIRRANRLFACQGVGGVGVGRSTGGGVGGVPILPPVGPSCAWRGAAPPFRVVVV